MKRQLSSILLFFFLIGVSCNSSNASEENIEIQIALNNESKITSVKVTGNENNYTFSVGILSPDTGCEQYANWWEVVTEDGQLIYRRILTHSHINEQPFVRSGGGVKISKDQIVIIRLHMNNTGYSLNTFKGSVLTGFNAFKTNVDFADNLSNQSPLPGACPF